MAITTLPPCHQWTPGPPASRELEAPLLQEKTRTLAKQQTEEKKRNCPKGTGNSQKSVEKHIILLLSHPGPSKGKRFETSRLPERAGDNTIFPCVEKSPFQQRARAMSVSISEHVAKRNLQNVPGLSSARRFSGVRRVSSVLQVEKSALD